MRVTAIAHAYIKQLYITLYALAIVAGYKAMLPDRSGCIAAIFFKAMLEAAAGTMVNGNDLLLCGGVAHVVSVF